MNLLRDSVHVVVDPVSPTGNTVTSIGPIHVSIFPLHDAVDPVRDRVVPSRDRVDENDGVHPEHRFKSRWTIPDESKNDPLIFVVFLRMTY